MANHTAHQTIVKLPKLEYLRLKQQAEAYRMISARVFEIPLCDPIHDVVGDFKATDLYTDEFLADLEDGLRKSSYAKKYGHQASKTRY